MPAVQAGPVDAQKASGLREISASDGQGPGNENLFGFSEVNVKGGKELWMYASAFDHDQGFAGGDRAAFHAAHFAHQSGAGGHHGHFHLH